MLTYWCGAGVVARDLFFLLQGDACGGSPCHPQGLSQTVQVPPPTRHETTNLVGISYLRTNCMRINGGCTMKVIRSDPNTGQIDLIRNRQQTNATAAGTHIATGFKSTARMSNHGFSISRRECLEADHIQVIMRAKKTKWASRVRREMGLPCISARSLGKTTRLGRAR
jgi:hypothetical protein